MAILDDIRNFLGKKPAPTVQNNPTTSFGQGLLKQIQPVTNFIQQNPTPAAFVNQQFQQRVAQPIVSGLKSAGQSYVNAIPAAARLSPPGQLLSSYQNYKTNANPTQNLLSQGSDFLKASPLVFGAAGGANIARQGLMSGIRSAVPSSLLGGVVSKATGGSFLEGVGSGIGSTPSIAGVTGLTNPIIDKTVGKVLGNTVNPLIKTLGSRVGTGLLNIPEGAVINTSLGKDTYGLGEAGLDFATGALFGPGKQANAKGFDFGRNKFSKWHPEDVNELDGVTDFIRRNRNLNDEQIKEADTIITSLGRGYLPKETIEKLAADFGRNSTGFLKGMVNELQKSLKSQESGMDGIKMGIYSGPKAKGFKNEGSFSSMADKKVRFEIDDSGATIKANNDNSFDFRNQGKSVKTLGDLLEHNELFKNYPEAKNIQITQSYGSLSGDGTLAYYNPKTNTIRINTKELNNPEKLKSTLLHEIQHAIQEKEGFARGGNLSTVAGFSPDEARQMNEVRSLLEQVKDSATPLYNVSRSNASPEVKAWAINLLRAGDDAVIDFSKNTPFQQYQRLSGEVEARDVQSRMNLSPEQRATTLPYQSQGIPVKDQIVRFDGGTQASRGLSSVKQLNEKYPNIKLSVYENSSEISVSQIVVPKDIRNQGIGTRVMQDLTDYADKTGKKIVLTPTSDFGGSKSRLLDFYKRFGFTDNKGKNKDFSTRESMIYTPKSTISKQSGFMESRSPSNIMASIDPQGKGDKYSDVFDATNNEYYRDMSKAQDDLMKRVDGLKGKNYKSDADIPKKELKELNRLKAIWAEKVKIWKEATAKFNRVDPQKANVKTGQPVLSPRDKKALGIEGELPVSTPGKVPLPKKQKLEGELLSSKESIAPENIKKTLDKIERGEWVSPTQYAKAMQWESNARKSPATLPKEPLQGKIPDLKAQIADARNNLQENTQLPRTPQTEMPVLKPSQSVPAVSEKPTLVGNKPPQESVVPEVSQQSPSVQSKTSPEIISRPQVPASDINVRRLDLDTEQQARVTDSQVKELRDVLTNKEIERIAQGAGIDTKTHTPDQVAKKIAEQLNARRQVTESEVQRTKLLESGAPLEELIKKTREIADRSRISREQGTEIAQQLAARRIIANEISTPMQRIFQLLDQAGVNPDVYVKDAATVDFNDGNAVVNFYRKYVPAGRREWIDLVRYNSMLSSPNTFINNAFSNLQGSALIAPIEKTITGGVDLIKSALTGSKREYYVGEGGAYAKGYFKAFDDAKNNFTSVLRGKKLVTNPDYKNIPLTQSGTLKRKIEDKLMGPMKFLEATDQFFTTMVKGGVTESLNYRAAKGGKTGDISIVAEAEAAKRLFRSKLGDNNGSIALDAIDVFANTVQKLKSSKNPAASFIARFTLPFVQTPTNILKQGVEYSPAGLLTLKGSSKKTEQLSKAIMGTSIAAGVAMLAGSDRLTWAEPTSEKQKAAFRAAGMQPYSVKIGDSWVSYSKLHPAIAFNFALVAALKNAEDNKDLDQTQVETILKASSNWLNFFADQSYVKSIGDTVAGFKGDIEAKTRIGGNYLQQAIPFRALSGWVARIVDPYQRKVDTDGSILQQQFDYLKTQIPFVSQTVPAREGPTGDPIKNQNKEFNAISPVRVTTENPEAKEEFKFLQEQSKLDKEKRQMKEKFEREARQSTTVEKVGAAESAEVKGKGLPVTQSTGGKLTQGPGNPQPTQQRDITSLSKMQKDRVKTYLEYGKPVTENDLVNYYLGDIEKPADNSGYEKTVYQRELLKAYEKVDSNDELSADQKKVLKGAISQESGLTEEAVKYSKVANQDNDLKYQYISDQIAGKNHEQILDVLANGRKESVTGDVLTSDEVLKDLYDEGIIDSQEFGALKKLKYTNSGKLKESKGTGKKLSGIKFDLNVKTNTKKFKYKRPTIRSAPVNLLGKSNLKALKFKGKPLRFKK